MSFNVDEICSFVLNQREASITVAMQNVIIKYGGPKDILDFDKKIPDDFPGKDNSVIGKAIANSYNPNIVWRYALECYRSNYKDLKDIIVEYGSSYEAYDFAKTYYRNHKCQDLNIEGLRKACKDDSVYFDLFNKLFPLEGQKND